MRKNLPKRKKKKNYASGCKPYRSAEPNDIANEVHHGTIEALLHEACLDDIRCKKGGSRWAYVRNAIQAKVLSIGALKVLAFDAVVRLIVIRVRRDSAGGRRDVWVHGVDFFSLVKKSSEKEKKRSKNVQNGQVQRRG